MSNWFKLDVNDVAAQKLHELLLQEKVAEEKLKKGDLIAKLITSAIKKLSSLEKANPSRKFPSGGMRTVQVDKAKHRTLLNRIDQFASDKGFHSRHFAARYCLYSELGIKLPDAGH